jgi:probable lipoprotein NlpC
MRPPTWCAEYVGLPFREKGRGPGGFDCWGLVRDGLEKQFGIIDLPDYVDSYTRTTDKLSVSAAVAAGLAQGWQRVAGPAAGVLVILRLAGRPWHCALAVDNEWFLHAVIGSNVCLERFDSMVWSDRIEGCYRHV